MHIGQRNDVTFCFHKSYLSILTNIDGGVRTPSEFSLSLSRSFVTRFNLALACLTIFFIIGKMTLISLDHRVTAR